MDVRIAAALLDEFAKLPEEIRGDGGDAAEATMLLDEFGNLPERIERPQTFMEIGGYPHYENVCSNFLAFFFDPDEAHGLGSLFLDALCEVTEGDDGEPILGGSISVEREVSTAEGNRIDLLITSDSHVFLIENKIFAGVVNPFKDYARHLESEEFRELAKRKVLLTLTPASEGREWGFVNLTYPAFIDRVRSMLGHHVSEADTRYLVIALDFLNTLENLQEGSRMNREFIELLNERGDEVERFSAALKAFRDELRKKVRDLQSLVILEAHNNVRQYIWRGDSPLFDVLVHDVYVDEKPRIGIDTRVHSWGWEIQFFPRQSGSWEYLRKILEDAEIPFEEGWRFLCSQRFDYDEDLNVVAPVVRELVEKIAAHSG